MQSVLWAYFGHHKCASQWIKNILQGVCRYNGLNLVAVHTVRLGDQTLPDFVQAHHLDFLAYVTAREEQVDLLGPFKGFHVIRDPRDICVSAYYSHLYSHPITEHNPYMQRARDALRKLSKDEGLLQVIAGRKEQFEDMYNWNYSRPNVLELTMESLVQNPYQGFLTIFRHLDLLDETRFTLYKRTRYLTLALMNVLSNKTRGIMPLGIRMSHVPAEILLGQVYANRFSAKSAGRQVGEENVKSHYRKGIAGDWGNHFKAEHISLFKKNYNDLLLKLGYENDDNW